MTIQSPEESQPHDSQSPEDRQPKRKRGRPRKPPTMIVSMRMLVSEYDWYCQEARRSRQPVRHLLRAVLADYRRQQAQSVEEQRQFPKITIKNAQTASSAAVDDERVRIETAREQFNNLANKRYGNQDDRTDPRYAQRIGAHMAQQVKRRTRAEQHRQIKAILAEGKVRNEREAAREYLKREKLLYEINLDDFLGTLRRSEKAYQATLPPKTAQQQKRGPSR